MADTIDCAHCGDSHERGKFQPGDLFAYELKRDYGWREHHGQWLCEPCGKDLDFNTKYGEPVRNENDGSIYVSIHSRGCHGGTARAPYNDPACECCKAQGVDLVYTGDDVPLCRKCARALESDT